MNPLKVLWFHMRARVRLFHIWLVVQIGLHRKAPSRLRSKLVKVSGWLEATVMNATSSESSIENRTRDAIIDTSNKLQSEMARIQQKDRRSLSKEDIDSIKDSFLHLLDLCGIKDADIPPLNEPVPLKPTQQTLITSFGIMSKSLSGASAMTTPPQRIRQHIRRDPASYADMLIEQLMANASPDSDTSPPSAEENRSQLVHGTTPLSSNTNHQQELMPLCLQFDHDSNPSSSSSHRQHLLSPASDVRCGWVEDNLAHPSHLQVRLTSDSGITASGSCHTITSSTTMSPPIQEGTLTSSKFIQNTTTGSTPELPAVVAASSSSQTLDIPFASFFGKLDNINSSIDMKPLPTKSNIPPQDCEEASGPENCYNFPLKYSHSYARELKRLETEMFSDLQLEPDDVPSPTPIPKNPSDKSSKDNRYIFHEPLVVILPEKVTSDVKQDEEQQNYNLNNNYKPSLEDKSGVVESEENSPKPPIPPRIPLLNPSSHHTQRQSKRLGHFVLACEPNKDIGSVWLSHKKDESSSESPCNMSWSYIDSPPQQVPSNSIVSNMSTGKAHVLEKKKGQGHYSCQFVNPANPSLHTPTSASKRRKANDKSPMPIEHSSTPTPRPTKSVRQRLFLSPARNNSPLRPSIGVASLASDPPSPTPTSNSPMISRMEMMRKNKRHSPAMRRLMQEKENNLLSTSKTQTSPRKPFGEMYNIQMNESDPLTTSSNSLSPSSENYAKSSDTSPDMPLPSREEDVLDRNAYYEDFTIDRDHKLDRLTPQQKKGFLRKNTQENFYTLKDPSSDEILVRRVEGAESSPKSKPVFQAPLPNTRAPRSIRMKSQTSRQQLPHPQSSSSSGSRSSSPSTSLNKYNSKTKKRVSSASRRSSSSSSCNSHPMASSTLIMEPSLSPEKDEETGSVYTWSIEEGSETCNLERSFLRSQSDRKNKKNNPHTPRPPTNVGCDSSDISEFEEMIDDKSSFQITAMVSAIEGSLNSTSSVLSSQQVDTFCEDSAKTPSKQVGRTPSLPRTSTRSTISGRGIVSAAPNLRNRITKSSTSHSSQSDGFSSNSTSSAALNKAKGSIQSIPSSDDQTETASMNTKNNVNTDSNLLKAISASAPNLVRHYHHESGDASHSLEPSDTDSTPEVASSILDERSDIPGKSNSSGSSSCTAARCRPREIPRVGVSDYSKISNQTTPTQPQQEKQSDQQQQHQPSAPTAQDLMDSILTDSPKSVDSSGIFAPYNSYNSPAESVGSHNGYSSTVSSSVPSSDSYFPITVRLVQGQQHIPPSPLLSTTPNMVPSPPPAVSDDSIFKRPFSPAPHIDRTARTPITRSQGVTATASCSSTPTRPTSAQSDPLANQSIFAVPPGIVTGPPKISNKKSLVKKLKRFSTNFYKRGEKIQTLTYL